MREIKFRAYIPAERQKGDNMERKGWLVGFVIVFIAGSCIFGVLFGGCYNGYSSGEREGTLVKFSYKGLLYKTYEGTLMMGVSMATPSSSFDFSVTDIKEIKILKQSLGKTIRVQYVEWLFLPIMKGGSNYLVEKVIIEKQKEDK